MKRIALYLLISLAAAGAETPQELYQKALVKERSEGKFDEAIQLYRRAADSAGKDRTLAAKALVQLGECYEKLGSTEARKQYDRVIRDYADQKDAVATARARIGGNAPHESEIVARQVWTNTDSFASGRPSPDGCYLASVNWPGGGNLAVHDLVTGDDRDITHRTDGSSADSPTFSPDGRHVFYQWYDGTADNWSLRLIDLDGSNERVFPINGYPGAISPSGKTAVVLLSQSGAQQIGTLDFASGKVTVLKSVAWRRPEIGNFSPDGRNFVYSLLVNQESRDHDIYLMAVDGSSEVKLVAAPGANGVPFFSPDGSHVVFTSDRSGHWDLWSINVSNGKAQGSPDLLKPEIGPVTNLGFSRDGTFFFRHQLNQADALIAELDTATWTVKGAPKRVSDSHVGSSASPAWSPDGKQLAYAVNRTRSGRYEGSDVTYVIRHIDSMQEREFNLPVSNPFFSKFIRWFRDGNSLLLPEWTTAAKRRLFRRLDLTTGKIQVLFDAPFSNNLNTIISSDAASLLYASYAEDEKHDRSTKYLMRHDLATGDEKVTFRIQGIDGPASLHGLSGSSNGQQIAFFRAVTEGKKMLGWSTWIASPSGGEPRDIGHPTGKWIIPNSSAWTPNGAGVLVIAGDDNSYFGKNQLWYVPIDGGDPHPVGISMPILESISFSPDGRHLGFTGGSNTQQVWQLKNLFPQIRAAR